MYDCNHWQGQQCHKSHKSHRTTGTTPTTPTMPTNGGDTQIKNLVGEMVKINRGGPESLVGTLLAVKSDYLVLATKEGVVYVDLSHVKSVTGLADGGKSGGGRSGGGRTTDFIKADNFKGVVKALQKEFVQINWGGPEKVEGFLAEVQGNTALVVVKNEVVYILVDHIKTIKKLSFNKSNGNKSGGNNNNQSGGNKNNNKSGNQGQNKSGNQSGAQAQGQTSKSGAQTKSTGNKSNKKSGGGNRSKKG